MKNATLLLVVLALLLAGSGPVRAESIGINFSAGGLDLQPTDQPGVAPGANWNNINDPTSAGGTAGNAIPLQDSSGSSTSALLSYIADAAYDGFSTPNFSNSARNTLYSGGLVGNPTDNQVNPGADVTITVSKIPYAKYDVYSYASQDTLKTNTLSITDGTTTFYYASNGNTNAGATSLLQTTSTDPLNPTTGPAQYQIFSGLTSSTFTLTTSGSIDAVVSNNVFGLQIVPDVAAAPEPGTLTLFTLGAAALCAHGVRRRRQPIAA